MCLVPNGQRRSTGIRIGTVIDRCDYILYELVLVRYRMNQAVSLTTYSNTCRRITRNIMRNPRRASVQMQSNGL